MISLASSILDFHLQICDRATSSKSYNRDCGAVPDLDGQAQWSVVSLLLRLIWVEYYVGVAQEVGLENVAAAAVLRKEPVVQVHFQTGCLEVQSHFRKEKE